MSDTPRTDAFINSPVSDVFAHACQMERELNAIRGLMGSWNDDNMPIPSIIERLVIAANGSSKCRWVMRHENTGEEWITSESYTIESVREQLHNSAPVRPYAE